MADNRCTECVAEAELGRREPFEVHDGTDECTVCGSMACESHGRNYDTNTVSGWAHESCKENWRAFVPENEPGYGRD